MFALIGIPQAVSSYTRAADQFYGYVLFDLFVYCSFPIVACLQVLFSVPWAIASEVAAEEGGGQGLLACCYSDFVSHFYRLI